MDFTNKELKLKQTVSNSKSSYLVVRFKNIDASNLSNNVWKVKLAQFTEALQK